MALIGKNGASISFESSELIEELMKDIAEFGETHMLAVWLRKIQEHEVEVVTNYDHMVEASPIEASEIGEDERIVFMTASALMIKLKEQDNIV